MKQAFKRNLTQADFIHRLVFIFLIFSIVSSSIFAQKGDKSVLFKKNAVFVELFGSSVFVYNITYDRIFFTKGSNNLSASLGVQFFPKLGLLDKNLISFSPQINYLRGNNVHYLELGAGIAFNLYYNQWGMPVRIGYRYQPEDKGFFFRAGLTPVITNCFPDTGSDFTFHWWGGAGFGWTFRDKMRAIDEIK